MAHNQRSAKKIIIDSLREVPFINHAVRKADISRTTFYRWLAKNKAFKYNVDAALKEGHKNMIEIAESVLLKKVKEGNVRAIEFYLEHNSGNYMNRKYRLEPLMFRNTRDADIYVDDRIPSPPVMSKSEEISYEKVEEAFKNGVITEYERNMLIREVLHITRQPRTNPFAQSSQ